MVLTRRTNCRWKWARKYECFFREDFVKSGNCIVRLYGYFFWSNKKLWIQYFSVILLFRQHEISFHIGYFVLSITIQYKVLENRLELDSYYWLSLLNFSLTLTGPTFWHIGPGPGGVGGYFLPERFGIIKFEFKSILVSLCQTNIHTISANWLSKYE